MKILVTGFEPFGGETVNPALEAINNLPPFITGAKIEILEVPTVFYQSARILEEKLLAYQPDVILCVGQAGGRVDVSLERVAINQDDARIPDNCGNQPIDQIIRKDGPAAYFSTLPIKAIVSSLQKNGIPSSISNSAGTFVCNHLMYQALYLAEKYLATSKVGFMHIPFLPLQAVNHPQMPSMSLEMVVKALEVCIETIVEYKDKKDVLLVGGQLH